MEHKADKGHPGGSCNREACQRPFAFWFNHGTQKYYCRDCAHAINRANPEGCAWTGGDGSPLVVLDETIIMQHVGAEAARYLQGEENSFDQMVMALRRISVNDPEVGHFVLAARTLSHVDLPESRQIMRDVLVKHGIAHQIVEERYGSLP